MKQRRTSLAAILMVVTTLHCSALGLTEEEEDTDTTTLLLLMGAAYLSTANPCSTTASAGTVGANSTLSLSSGCVNGVVSSMDSSMPTWLKNNFKCSLGYTVSSYYCFKSKNLLNAKSYYYQGTAGTGLSENFNTMAGARHTNPNYMTSQNITYAIPMTPSRNTGSLTSTQGGLVSIGIGVNGLAIFNNAAAAPDTLSDEAETFDDQEGHPQNSGVYHHHAQYINGDGTAGGLATVNLTTAASSQLIGVALDGYAIYGQFCGSATTGQNATASGLDSLHGHTTTTPDFSTATYHYHYGGTTGGGNDATAGIPTLMGSYFYGNVGKVSN